MENKIDRYTAAIMALEESKVISENVYQNLLGGNIPPELKKSTEALDIAIEALEKQVAKPVVAIPRIGYILPDYCCPTCGDLLSVNFGRSRVKYCDQCGQRLTF